jgi:hypothetical protein
MLNLGLLLLAVATILMALEDHEAGSFLILVALAMLDLG